MAGLSPNMIDHFRAAAGLGAMVEKFARAQKLDIDTVAMAVDIDLAEFNNPASTVSLDRLCRMLEILAVVANDDTIGLKIGAAFTPGGSGPFGYGILSAPTIGDLIKFVGEHLDIAADLNFCTIQEDENSSLVSWTYSPLIVRRNQFADMGFAAVFARLRDILDVKSTKIQVEMEREKPINDKIFKELLNTKIRFGQKCNSIRIPAEFREIKNPRGDENLFRLMKLQCQMLKRTNPDHMDLLEIVKLEILETLGDKTPNLHELALQLRLSERTLQRRLARAETSLQDLVDDCRRELADHLLHQTDIPLAQISEKLGFSAPSVFSRAATRWFGTTPRQIRQRSGQQT